MLLIGDNNFPQMRQRIRNIQNLIKVRGDAIKGGEMIIIRICHYIHFKDNSSI